MFKKALALVALSSLAACGPGQPPPPPANQQPPPPPTAAAPQAAPAEVAPTEPSQEALREAERRGEREERDRLRERAAEQAAAAPQCGDCGVIANIQEERIAGEPTYIGTLGGAAAGGLAGDQFGHKSGKIAMAVLGAVGGAFAGREVESQVRARTVYHVIVNMASGQSRSVTVETMNGLGVGSRVHVDGNSLSYAG